MNVVLPVRTVSSVHFTGAIAAAGAAATEHLAPSTTVPEGLAAGRTVRSRLKSIRILSVQLLPWEVQLFHRATGIGGSVIDTESFVGTWSFPGSGNIGDGSRATSDTFYYYYIDGLDVPYEDLDVTGKVHVRLVNRHAATAKIAGADGAIAIELGFEISGGRP